MSPAETLLVLEIRDHWRHLEQLAGERVHLVNGKPSPLGKIVREKAAAVDALAARLAATRNEDI